METGNRTLWKLSPALRVTLAALFVYAGAAKLTDVPAFAAQVRHFGLPNPAAAWVFAHYLPFLEIGCGLAMFVQSVRGGAMLLCMVLLVMFEGGLGYAWYAGYTGGCGCFGKFFGGANVETAFVRNLVLLALAGTLLLPSSSVSRQKAA